MPLPLIPIVLGAASLLAGGVGIKKGLDAKEMFERAEAMGRRAERRHRQAVQALDERREQTFAALKELGQKKADVFTNAARVVVDLIERARARAQFHEYELSALPIDELHVIKRDIGQIESLQLTLDAGKGLAMAALGASGIYGTVGALATASTGTAIASLSGAAATNATLAWLGGGSLAAGGLGVAGGTWVLGGLVAGPALALLGFTMANHAEQALTEAEKYVAEVEQKIAELELLQDRLAELDANIQETHKVLDGLNEAFKMARASYSQHIGQPTRDETMASKLQHLLMIFKAIKEVVQTPLLDQQGAPVTGLGLRYTKILEVSNIRALPTLPAKRGKA